MATFGTARLCHPICGLSPRRLGGASGTYLEQFPDDQALSADEARTLLWVFAGNVSKAARYYKMPSQRLRAFITQSSRIAAELNEARERILDRAEAVLCEALFSDDPKRRESAARYLLMKSLSGARDFPR